MAKKKVVKKYKKRYKVSKAKVVSLILVLLILIFLIITLLSRKENPIVGKWSTDKGTVYQFNKDYTGKLILSIGEYNYKYEIKDDKVIIDFESEKSTDTEFIYKIEDGKLILKNSNGTFTFKKAE